MVNNFGGADSHGWPRQMFLMLALNLVGFGFSAASEYGDKELVVLRRASDPLYLGHGELSPKPLAVVGSAKCISPHFRSQEAHGSRQQREFSEFLEWTEADRAQRAQSLRDVALW